MNIFITGGTGFIGSHLVTMLGRAGHTVTILARNPAKISPLRGLPGLHFVDGTLADGDTIREAMRGCEACIHCALGWGETAAEMVRNDTVHSIDLFEKAVQTGVRRVIYTSSISAVGDFRPKMDAETALRPNSLYSATKAATENYLLAIAAQYNLQCAIIRPSYTFGNPAVPGGPMQPDRRFIDIVNSALRNEPISLIQHDGTQFIGVEDLTKLYAHALSTKTDRTIFFGVGSGYITWESIARYAVEFTKSQSTIALENRGWEPGAFIYDYTIAEKLFGAPFSTIDRLNAHIKYIAEVAK
jgi:UDP-glucose 4-epimerase